MQRVGLIRMTSHRISLERPTPRLGGNPPMGSSLPLLLIIIGIVLAILVHYALGIVCILIGLVLLIWPRVSAGRGGAA